MLCFSTFLLATLIVVQASATNEYRPKNDHAGLDEITVTSSGPMNSSDYTRTTSNQVNANVQQRSTQLPGTNCFVGNITEGFGFDDNFQENNGDYGAPATPQGAVGTDRLVATVQSMIEIRSKNGTLIYRDSFVDFFASLGTKSNSTDKGTGKVVYDEYERRFAVAVAIVDVEGIQSYTYVAVSKNELPIGPNSWNFLRINTTVAIGGNGTFFNYPYFKAGKEALYLLGDMFTFSTFDYRGARLWIVDKGLTDGFYGSGASPVVRGPFDPNTDNVLSPQPIIAQAHGSAGIGNSIGAFLVAFNATSRNTMSLKVTTVLNPQATTPTFNITYINLGTIHQSPFFEYGVANAPQLGTSNEVGTFLSFLYDAVWSNNKLWITSHVNAPNGNPDVNQTTVYWARFDTTGGNIKFEAQGYLGGESFSSRTFTYYPAIEVNKEGKVALGYSASSSSLYVGAYGSLLDGTNDIPFTIKSGEDYYNRFVNVNVSSSFDNIWGYQSSISVDPVDDSFWIFNQFADTRGTPLNVYGFRGDGRWGTVWGRVYCPKPTSAPTKAPSKAPTKTPTKSPTNSPTKSPTRNDCGLFGLNIFCPFTFCGVFGRLLGLCD